MAGGLKINEYENESRFVFVNVDRMGGPYDLFSFPCKTSAASSPVFSLIMFYLLLVT